MDNNLYVVGCANSLRGKQNYMVLCRRTGRIVKWASSVQEAEALADEMFELDRERAELVLLTAAGCTDTATPIPPNRND